MPSLPLFPLGTVLAPGGQLPLQVFEPRYVQLLADLLGQDDEPRAPEFGVVAIRAGLEVGVDRARDLHSVGTVARIVQAASMEDQRFLVIGIGSQRFHLDGLDASASTPYPTGIVTYLDEPDGEGIDLVAARARGEVEAYLRQTGSDADLSEDPWRFSHQIGDAMGLDLIDRQQLLACPDTATRLRLGLRLVLREKAVANTFGAVPGQPERLFGLN